MPTYQSAKDIAEKALRTIGAYPTTQSQADEGELKTTLEWLEMVINEMSGIRPWAGFWRLIDIPLEGGIGDYILSDYADAAETQHVFSAAIVDRYGNVDPMHLMYESVAADENITRTGSPWRAVVTKDVQPVIKLFPVPTQDNEDAGDVLRLRTQTYHPSINGRGIGQTDLLVRPSWYLWLTKRVAYEIGNGPVRRLAENELKRMQDDYERMGSLLLARDGQYNSGKPPVTEPMPGSFV